jgi:hypothetical protein
MTVKEGTYTYVSKLHVQKKCMRIQKRITTLILRAYDG